MAMGRRRPWLKGDSADRTRWASLEDMGSEVMELHGGVIQRIVGPTKATHMPVAQTSSWLGSRSKAVPTAKRLRETTTSKAEGREQLFHSSVLI
jgi:hypothetical protein